VATTSNAPGSRAASSASIAATGSATGFPARTAATISSWLPLAAALAVFDAVDRQHGGHPGGAVVVAPDERLGDDEVRGERVTEAERTEGDRTAAGSTDLVAALDPAEDRRDARGDRTRGVGLLACICRLARARRPLDPEVAQRDAQGDAPPGERAGRMGEQHAGLAGEREGIGAPGGAVVAGRQAGRAGDEPRQIEIRHRRVFADAHAGPVPARVAVISWEMPVDSSARFTSANPASRSEASMAGGSGR
jgi:hypothetical protein